VFAANVENTRPDDVVDVHEVAPSIRVDLAYFSAKNFVGERIEGYRANTCYLTRKAALALREAQSRLLRIGAERGKQYGLLVLDCYRPKRAVDHFVRWAGDASSTKTKRDYFPELSKADLVRLEYVSPQSKHTHASTVDLTIIEIVAKSARPLEMGSSFDFFGERSHTAFTGLAPAEKASRELLLRVMAPAFQNYAKEWWHFTLKDEPYPNTVFDFDIEAPR
jgi:D-alanyl-D-alanine dipeptidase